MHIDIEMIYRMDILAPITTLIGKIEAGPRRRRALSENNRFAESPAGHAINFVFTTATTRY